MPFDQTLRWVGAFFSLIATVASAQNHTGAASQTKAPSAVTVDCLSPQKASFTVDLDPLRRELLLVTRDFLRTAKAQKVDANLQESLERLAIPEHLWARTRTEGRDLIEALNAAVEEASALVAAVRKLRLGPANEENDRKLDAKRPGTGDGNTLQDYLEGARDLVEDAVNSRPYRAMVKRVLALPEVRLEEKNLVDKVERLAQKLDEVQGQISQRRNAKIRDIIAASKPGSKVDNEQVLLQADSWLRTEDDAVKLFEQRAAIENEVFAYGEQLSDLRDEGLFGSKWSQWTVGSARAVTPAEKAIVRHFRSNEKDLRVLRANTELRRLWRVLSEKVDSEEQRLDEVLSEETANTQRYRNLTHLFRPGASVAAGFAIAVQRDPDTGRLHPTAILPVVGKPKMPGLGIPVRLFESSDEETPAAVKRKALASVANVLEDPSVQAHGTIDCLETVRK